jgi:hypothetical protein
VRKDRRLRVSGLATALHESGAIPLLAARTEGSGSKSSI